MIKDDIELLKSVVDGAKKAKKLGVFAIDFNTGVFLMQTEEFLEFVKEYRVSFLDETDDEETRDTYFCILKGEEEGVKFTAWVRRSEAECIDIIQDRLI